MFTKGKWEIDDRGTGSLKVCINLSDPINQQTICQLSGYGDDPEVKANALLIASAPELLEACIDFCEKVESGRARSVKSYGKMKSIIDKVKNTQP